MFLRTKCEFLFTMATGLAFLGVLRALTIDNQLTVIKSDCYERLAIGQRLSPKDVYKTAEANTVKDCQMACTKEQELCKSFSFGIGVKGNSTCELSTDLIKETADLKPIGTVADTDFDLYIKKLGCTIVIDKNPNYGGTPTENPHQTTTKDPYSTPVHDNYDSAQQNRPTSIRPSDSGYHYHKPQSDYEEQHVQTLVSVSTGPQKPTLHPVHEILIGENPYIYGYPKPPFRPPVLNHPYDNPRPGDYDAYGSSPEYAYRPKPDYSSRPNPFRPDYYSRPKPERPDYDSKPYPGNPDFDSRPDPDRPSYDSRPYPNRPNGGTYPNRYADRYEPPTYGSRPMQDQYGNYPTRPNDHSYRPVNDYLFNQDVDRYDPKPNKKPHGFYDKPTKPDDSYDKPSGPPIDPDNPNSGDYDRPTESRPTYPANNIRGPSKPEDPHSKPIITQSVGPHGESITSIITELRDACFRRVLAGKRVARGFVKRSLICERIEDCQRECADEKHFVCEGFNYRLDPSGREKGECELLDLPLAGLDIGRDLYPDPDYDYYERDRNAAFINCHKGRPSGYIDRDYYHSSGGGGHSSYDDYYYDRRYDGGGGGGGGGYEKRPDYDRWDEDRDRFGERGPRPRPRPRPDYPDRRPEYDKSGYDWYDNGNRRGDFAYHHSHNSQQNYENTHNYHFNYDGHNSHGGVHYLPPSPDYRPHHQPLPPYDYKSYEPYLPPNRRPHDDRTIIKYYIDRERDQSYWGYNKHKWGSYGGGYGYYDRRHDYKPYDSDRRRYYLPPKVGGTKDWGQYGGSYGNGGFNLQYNGYGHSQSFDYWGFNKHDETRHGYGQSGGLLPPYKNPPNNYLPERPYKPPVSGGYLPEPPPKRPGGSYLPEPPHRPPSIDGGNYLPEPPRRPPPDDGGYLPEPPRRPPPSDGGYLPEPPRRPPPSDGGYLPEPPRRPPPSDGGYLPEPPRRPPPGDGGYLPAPPRRPPLIDGGYLPEPPRKPSGGDYLPEPPRKPPPSGGSYLPRPPSNHQDDFYNSILPAEPRVPHYNFLKDECSLRTATGFRLHKGIVKKFFAVPSIYECELLCFKEKDFPCASYAYRYTVSLTPPTDNCYLSNRNYKELDFYTDLQPDRDFDIYTMNNQNRCEQPIILGKDNSECFWRVRSAARLDHQVVRDSLNVKSIVQCQIECIRSSRFTCRAFSFRYGSPVIGGAIDNCQLTDWPYYELDPKIHFIPEPGFELYERGSYGHGCEPDHFGIRGKPWKDPGNQVDQLCYVGFGSPARLLPQATRKTLRVQSELDCKAECSKMREGTLFQCMSFSYRNSGHRGAPNCELSDILQRDLLPHIDYMPDPDSWLFAWDNYNPECIALAREPVHNNIGKEGGIENRLGHYDPMHALETWRVYSVSGWPCRRGSVCQENREAGFWFCELEGGNTDSWDYCCRPDHQCGYSEGFAYQWCYVGPVRTQWRKCSDRYYPYVHNIIDRIDHRPPHGGNNIRDKWPLPPIRDKWHPPQIGEEWPSPHRPGIRPDRPPAPPTRPPPRPSLDEYEMEFDNQFLEPPKPGGFGQPRHWPVSYLHKERPPNNTDSEPRLLKTSTEQASNPKFAAIQSLIDVIKSNDLKNVQYQITNESNKEDDILFVKIPLPTNFTEETKATTEMDANISGPIDVTSDLKNNTKRSQESLPNNNQFVPIYRRSYVTRTNVTHHRRSRMSSTVL